MRIFSVFIAIAFASCLPCCQQTASAQWPQSTSYQPTVQIEFGGKAYDREGAGNGTPVAIDGSNNQTLVNAEQASDLGSAAGLEGKVIFQLPRVLREVELRVIQATWEEDMNMFNSNLTSPFLDQGIQSVAQFAGITATDLTNPLLPPGITAADLAIPLIPIPTAAIPPLGVPAVSLVNPQPGTGTFVEGLRGANIRDFFAANQYRSYYNSEFASIELMSRRNTQPGLTWLAGPRFISIREDSAVTVLGSSPVNIFFPPGSGAATTLIDATAAARAQTTNSLIGLQAGLEYNLPVTQDIYLQAYGRVGAYYNSVSVDRELSALRPTALARDGQFDSGSSQSSSGEAFVADFGIRAYVDVIPNCVSLYAGFEGVFIDNIAVAPSQLLDLSTVDDTSEAFMRALSFGTKMTY